MLICSNHVDVNEGVRRCARCQSPFCRDCLVEIAGRPYCATCKTEQLLDVRSGVDYTRLNLASNWNRFGALIIDNFLAMLPYLIAYVFLLLSMSQQKEPNPLMFLAILPLSFVPLVYEGLMYQYRNGQTLGKMALQVRVVRADGTALTPGRAGGRAAMKFILSGCLSIFDFIPALFTDEKTTLHDLVAGTRVIQA